MCCIFGLFFVHTLPFLCPLFLYLSPSPLPFYPAPPLPKEVNKKISYRRRNAVSIINTHERNTDCKHILYISVRQHRLSRHLMLSTCPFIRPSVCLSLRSFFCYQLVNARLRNEWTDCNVWLLLMLALMTVVLLETL